MTSASASASDRSRSRPRISATFARAIAAVALMALVPSACGGVSGPAFRVRRFGSGVSGSGVSGSGVTGVGTNPSPSSPGSPFGLSRCMRAHGRSNFPDPQFGGSGAVKSGPGAPGGGIDPNAPAFKASAKLCGPIQD